MKAVFNYNEEKTFKYTLELESVGNVCLQAIDVNNNYYYLAVRTLYGISEIITYGPIAPTLGDTENYSITFQKAEYDEDYLYDMIDKWLNKRRRHMSTVNIINEETFFTNLIDVREFLYEYYKADREESL